jgi:formate hydrogenlyase subunit 6/NADH:ubiquinone oxidoreductase subunit I
MTCNVCVEVCPVQCLTMAHEYAPATTVRRQESYRQREAENDEERTHRKD